MLFYLLLVILFIVPHQKSDLLVKEIDAGLPVSYAMASIFGKSGAVAGLVTLFMSVTSATSAELIAFSSVSTYDIYRIYVKSDASGKQLVRVHFSVIGFGLFMAVLSVVFNYIGVTVGCPSGTAIGIGSWIGATYHYGEGIVNKDTLMITEATFIGNIAAISSAAIIIAAVSLLKPDTVPYNMNQLEGDFSLGDDVDKEGKDAGIINEKTKKLLKRHSTWSLFANFFVIIGVYIIVSVLLYGIQKDLSRSSFIALIVIMLMWLLAASIYIILTPLWQGRHSIGQLICQFTHKSDDAIHSNELETEDAIEVEEVHEIKS